MYWQPLVGSAVGGAAVGAALASRGGEGRGQERRQSTCVSFLRMLNIGVVILSVVLFLSKKSETIQLGVKEQRLISNNWLFCDSMKVVPISGSSGLPTYLYTFSQTPRLRAFSKWTENYSPLTVRKNGYESWMFWFNTGSKIKISYEAQSRSVDLELAVIKGGDKMKEWEDDPNSFNSYESHSRITKSGSFSFTARSDGEYYFALGNFNYYDIQLISVELEISSLLYDLSHFKSRCFVSLSTPCKTELPFGGSGAIILATPLDSESDSTWSVRVAYSPRWETYFCMIGLVWFLTFTFRTILEKQEARRILQSSQQFPPSYSPSSSPSTFPIPESQPLVNPSIPRRPSLFSRFFQKLPSVFQNQRSPSPNLNSEERVAPIPESWVPSNTTQESLSSINYSNSGVSNYTSTVGQGETERERGVEPSAPPIGVLGSVFGGIVVQGRPGEEKAYWEEGKKGEEREGDVCSVCMDAKKDSILVDCGHRATCFSCGNMLLQANPPLCPICRKRIRQVVKIFDA